MSPIIRENGFRLQKITNLFMVVKYNGWRPEGWSAPGFLRRPRIVHDVIVYGMHVLKNKHAIFYITIFLMWRFLMNGMIAKGINYLKRKYQSDSLFILFFDWITHLVIFLCIFLWRTKVFENRKHKEYYRILGSKKPDELRFFYFWVLC